MLQNNPNARADVFNSQLAQVQTRELLRAALNEQQFGKVALVSSFGAEAVVLLHMVSQLAPETPVLFIDTLMLFDETLEYQRSLSAQFGLSDVRILRAKPDDIAQEDPSGSLHRSDPDRCCALRKAQPLKQALAGFDTWISGRKRFQGGARTDLTLVEVEPKAGRIKLNPLANWTAADTRAYIKAYDLPQHPLIRKGFGSIGCAPCTVPAEGRAGRWKGQSKTECGIHFENGAVIRNGANA